MSTAEVDAYLASLPHGQREALEALRAQILDVLPGAQQGISYGVPAFLVDGRRVAGFSAASKHLSYLPHSGTVLGGMKPAVLAGYEWSKGAIRFTVEKPITDALVAALIAARLTEVGLASAEPT